jgi:hypothetical protein
MEAGMSRENPEVVQTKWVTFTELEIPETRRTAQWYVSGSGGILDHLGYVEYHGMWHAFIFRSGPRPIRLSVSCMVAIAEFVDEQNAKHRGDLARERAERTT